MQIKLAFKVDLDDTAATKKRLSRVIFLGVLCKNWMCFENKENHSFVEIFEKYAKFEQSLKIFVCVTRFTQNCKLFYASNVLSAKKMLFSKKVSNLGNESYSLVFKNTCPKNFTQTNSHVLAKLQESRHFDHWREFGWFKRYAWGAVQAARMHKRGDDLHGSGG